MENLCPSCQASDNNPYVDARGKSMRACGRCMIQWESDSAVVAPTPQTELERYKKWKKRIDTAFTAGMLGMEHEALMGGRRLSAHEFVTSLRVAMREAETEFMTARPRPHNRMSDEELTADDNWCPYCGDPREACLCSKADASPSLAETPQPKCASCPYPHDPNSKCPDR